MAVVNILLLTLISPLSDANAHYIFIYFSMLSMLIIQTHRQQAGHSALTFLSPAHDTPAAQMRG